MPGRTEFELGLSGTRARPGTGVGQLGRRLIGEGSAATVLRLATPRRA